MAAPPAPQNRSSSRGRVMLVVMAAPVFWLVIAALSMLNFGADLIVAGSAHLSGGDVMVMTGSWLMVGGVAILVWAATRRRLPRREVGHDVDRHLVAADDRAAVRRIRHAHHLFRGRVGQLDAFRHVPAPGNPADGHVHIDHVRTLRVSAEPDARVLVAVPRHARSFSRADLHDCLL